MNKYFLLEAIKTKKKAKVEAETFQKIFNAASGHGYQRSIFVSGEIVDPEGPHGAVRFWDTLSKVLNEHNGPHKMGIGIKGISDKEAQHKIREILELCERKAGGFSVKEVYEE